MTVTFDTTAQLILAGASMILAAVAAYVAWRRTAIRDTRALFGIAALRGVFVLLACLLLSDPAITRTVTSLPVLTVVRDSTATLDTADEPGGRTRRDALDHALAEARASGLSARFDVVDGPVDGDPNASLLLTDESADPAIVSTAGGRVFALEPLRDPAIPDLSIVGVRAPHVMVAGAPAEIDVVTRARGARGRSMVVTASDSGRMLGSVTRDVDTDDSVQTTAIVVTPQSVGWQRLAVEVAGLTGEVSLGDNRSGVWAEVRPADRRVLFIEGEPTWEGKFVRRALEADSGVTVDYVAQISKTAVIAQPEASATPASPSASTPKGGWADLHAALAADRLFGYDALILGALDSDALTAAEVERIRTFVDRRGGSLVVLGSNGYSGSVLSGRGALQELLPATIPAASLGRREAPASPSSGVVAGGVVLAPAEGMDRHPIFAALGDAPAKTLAGLQHLGDGYLKLGPLKPGAVAVAVDASAKTEEKPPLVVAQDYGLGRVVLVAPADTWRLAVGAPSESADASSRLWSALVAWASSGAEPPVFISASSPVARVDAATRIELVVRSKDFTPVAATRVTARAELETPDNTADAGATAMLDFLPDPATPGVFVASPRLEQPGTWKFVAETDAGEAVACRLQVEPASASSERGAPDPIRAERFAAAIAAHGGKVFRTNEIAQLIDALGSPEPRTHVVTSRPARTPWWALVLPLLFAAEIFARRWYAAE